MSDALIKVLLIDDDELQYAIFNQILAQVPNTHYQLDWVRTYEEALAQMILRVHDIYLVDYHLEDKDGTFIIQEGLKQGCKAPMILQTSNTNRHVDVEAMEAGAVDYLIKTEITPALLERSIRYAIRQKDVENQLEEQNQIIAQHVQEAERTNRYLTELTQRITLDLEQARHTQRSLLPAIPQTNNYKIVTKYEPMEQIGGDFYDFYELDDEQIGILLVDVTGHGIPAALISFMVSSLFKTFAPKLQDIEDTITLSNNTLHDKLPNERFATIVYSIYDARTRQLSYSTMGHPPCYLIRAKTQEVIPFKTKGILIGAFALEGDEFEVGTLQLEAGDKVLFYTDGLLEMEMADGELFGQERLETFISQNMNLPIDSLIDVLYLHILRLSGALDYTDDVTIIGLEIDE